MSDTRQVWGVCNFCSTISAQRADTTQTGLPFVQFHPLDTSNRVPLSLSHLKLNLFFGSQTLLCLQKHLHCRRISTSQLWPNGWNMPITCYVSCVQLHICHLCNFYILSLLQSCVCSMYLLFWFLWILRKHNLSFCIWVFVFVFKYLYFHLILIKSASNCLSHLTTISLFDRLFVQIHCPTCIVMQIHTETQIQ